MTPALIEKTERRLGVKFPESWKTWSPETERSWVRGVAELYHPDDYVVGANGEIVIGTSSDVEELAFLPMARNPKVLRDAVYVLGQRRPKKIVASFLELVVRPRLHKRPDELLYEKRTSWAAYLCGEIRVCPACGKERRHPTCACPPAPTRGGDAPVAVRSAEDVARAGAELPALFAAAELVVALRDKHPWIGNSQDVLALETARLRGLPASALVDRWRARGLEPDDIPVAELERFLAKATS